MSEKEEVQSFLDITMQQINDFIETIDKDALTTAKNLILEAEKNKAKRILWLEM